jgi:hypothetical protein
MVRFHIFNTSKLATELSVENPSERVAYYYLLSTELFIVVLLYFSLFSGAYINWLFFLQLVIILLITFIGLYEAFLANGSDQGEAFLVRSICLLFPITVNLTLLSEALGFLIFRLLPVFADPVIFTNPVRTALLIDFIWTPVFAALMFWRLNVHIRRIGLSRSPNLG